MKKLVIKTVVITLLAAAMTAVTVFLIITLAFPATIAGFYGDVGDYRKAANYEIKAYERDGSISHAVAAGDYALKSGDDELVAKTVVYVINDDEYDDFASENVYHATMLTSKYIVAEYLLNGASEQLIDKAFSLLVGYVDHNQVESLIVAAYEKRDKETLTAVYNRLSALDKGSLSESEKVVLSNDLTILEKAIS